MRERSSSSRDSRDTRDSRDSGERSGGAGGASGGKRTFFKRRKSCPFSGPKGRIIDWKDVRMLNRFISERGKMMPSRITAVSTKKQRELAKAIKRARYMALLSATKQEQESRSWESRKG